MYAVTSTSRCRFPSRRMWSPCIPSDLDKLALAFTGTGFDDSQQVGGRLVRHPLTASLLRVAADRPRRWPDAVAAIAQQTREWSSVLADDPRRRRRGARTVRRPCLTLTRKYPHRSDETAVLSRGAGLDTGGDPPEAGSLA